MRQRLQTPCGDRSRASAPWVGTSSYESRGNDGLRQDHREVSQTRSQEHTRRRRGVQLESTPCDVGVAQHPFDCASDQAWDRIGQSQAPPASAHEREADGGSWRLDVADAPVDAERCGAIFLRLGDIMCECWSSAELGLKPASNEAKDRCQTRHQRRKNREESTTSCIILGPGEAKRACSYVEKRAVRHDPGGHLPGRSGI